MRRLLNSRPLLYATALALVGCVKTHDDVTVKADGSGSFSESTVMDLAAAAALGDGMKEMGGMFGGGMGGMGGGGMPPGPGTPPPGTPPTPEPGAKPPEGGAAPGGPTPPPTDPVERIKQRYKDIPGLEVTKFAPEMKDGKMNLTVEATFKTLEDYAKASGIEMGSSLVKNDDGSYTLQFEGRFGGRGGRRDSAPHGEPGMDGEPGMGGEPGMAGEPGMDGAPGGPGGPGGAMMGAMMPMLEKYLAGLEWTRTLKLPGTIVETNGTRSEDGSSVTWKLTFADMKDGKAAPQTVTFKGDGLDLKPFTVKRSARRGFMGGGRGGPGGPGGPPPVAPGAPGTPPTGGDPK